MKVGVLLLHLRFVGSDSLKAKRSRLLPLLARLRREFNISAAEVDMQDSWQDAVVACAVVNTRGGAAERSLQEVVTWVERNWHDAEVVSDQIELV
ncbi:MAG: DUF503 domain-containing protein [Anaerolineales bacterium]|nr:MAG: DUF503 domain-containing protein [Anaerolineales bacterium]